MDRASGREVALLLEIRVSRSGDSVPVAWEISWRIHEKAEG